MEVTHTPRGNDIPGGVPPQPPSPTPLALLENFADVYDSAQGAHSEPCRHEQRWSVRELMCCRFTWRTLLMEAVLWSLLVTYVTEWIFDTESAYFVSYDVVCGVTMM